MDGKTYWDMIEKGTRFLKKWYKHNREYIRDEFAVYGNIKKQNFLEAYEEVHLRTSPVFVLSTGRCGTQFLTRLFEKSGESYVNHDRQPELIYHSKVAYEKYETESGQVKMMFDAARFEMMLDAYLQNRLYIETNNRITFFAHQILELFPNSKFIHVVRHPATFVRSGVSYNWYSGKNLHDMGRLIPKNIPGFAGLSPVAQAGWLWNETNLFIEKFKHVCPPEQFFFVNSEDLFKSRASLEQILKFAGAKEVSTVGLDKLLSKPVNEQTRFNMPEYQNWNEEQKQELSRFIDKELTTKYDYTL